jgi:hypothetical protein
MKIADEVAVASSINALKVTRMFVLVAISCLLFSGLKPPFLTWKMLLTSSQKTLVGLV